MKRRVVFFIIYFFLLNLVFSIDIFDLEDAIINYIPNSKSQSFIPVLQEYGFTEAQINSWRFTNSFIDQYYSQIYQVISGDRFNKIMGPDHFIRTIRAVGEIKEDDLENLQKFLNDTYNVAQQINDERLKELEKKIISHENNLIIYGYNIIYDGNGNTDGIVPVDANLYRSGTLVELKDCGTMEKEGHKFMGWAENKEAASWISSSKININRDITLYAVWIDFETLNRQSATQEIQQRQNTERMQNLGYTVYIGRSGSKYHRANCRTLRNGSISIGVNTAKSRGYTACKICKP
jgi:hypothetical protein